MTPVVPGIFETHEGGTRLLTSRCAGCGSHYFPRGSRCTNPDCLDKTLLDDRLSDTGVLYSYTIQCYQPPGIFPMEQWAPYIIGVVEFAQGVRVMGMVRGVESSDLAIGMRLRTAEERLSATASGDALSTYVFVPSEGGAP
jgi:uncharacterized OB-fold protein